MLRTTLDKAIVNGLDKAARIQDPMVNAYVGWVRKRHPEDSDARLVGRLERRYLVIVTVSGTAVGLGAALPGIGTLFGLAASGVDTLTFLEASTMLVVGAAAVHGIDVDDRGQENLVTKVVLGEAGADTLGKTAGHSRGKWVGVIVDHVPVLSTMPEGPAKRFIVNYLVKRLLLMFGSVIPAGIGAVIGGTGNYSLGKSVIANMHSAIARASATAPGVAITPTAVSE